MGKLGENIVVTGAAALRGGGGEVLGAYAHPPANKIGVLVKLDGGNEELARQLAMHISFAAPEWATRDDVPAETVAAEREIYLNSDEVQSKPEAAREKIVDGMLAQALLRGVSRRRPRRPGVDPRRLEDGRRGARGCRRDVAGRVHAGLRRRADDDARRT